MDADVVIVGAGPTGLLLARELRLAGLAPIVLERLTEPTGLSKALGLIGRSVDFLDYRACSIASVPAGRWRRPARCTSP